MSGTIAGGKAAAATNKRLYGADFYARIGAEGGKKGNTGGFATPVVCTKSDCPYDYLDEGTRHLVRECAGARGGVISRRTK